MSILMEPLLTLLAIFLPILGCYALIEMQMSNKEMRHPKAIVSFDIRTAVHEKIATATARTYPARTRKYRHICPTCGKKHFVKEARHRLAYGKQFACSCACDIARRRVMGSLW